MLPDVSSFGNRLRRARVLRGCTRNALASHLGIHPHTVGRWERDEASPGARNLAAAAQHLQVSPLWLASGEGPKPKF